MYFLSLYLIICFIFPSCISFFFGIKKLKFWFRFYIYGLIHLYENNMPSNLLAFICHAIMDEQLRVLFIAFEKAIYGKYILSTVAGALKNIFLGQFVILSFFIMYSITLTTIALKVIQYLL